MDKLQPAETRDTPNGAFPGDCVREDPEKADRREYQARLNDGAGGLEYVRTGSIVSRSSRLAGGSNLLMAPVIQPGVVPKPSDELMLNKL
jgi:hypothetical protein